MKDGKTRIPRQWRIHPQLRGLPCRVDCAGRPYRCFHRDIGQREIRSYVTQRRRFEQAKKEYEQPVLIVTEEEARENEQTKASGEKTWIFDAKNVRDFGCLKPKIHLGRHGREGFGQVAPGDELFP